MDTSFNLFDFAGGVHPAENKNQSTQSEIAPAGIPEKLVLPLTQHIGAQSTPLVNVGDSVLKGQLIAQAQGFISANLHAPTSGKITAIEDRAIAHQSGLPDLCIEITADKHDTWIEHSGLSDYENADPQKLIAMIQQAGITGMGGAGFPTHVKVSANPTLIKTLIINAAECEPYITADDMLIQERAADVVSGIQILANILKPESILIGIEDNKPEAVKALNKAIEQLTDNKQITVVVIPTKYPSGGEKQLIQILTGKEVPNKGLPSDLGIVCQNIGTAYAIHNAIIKGEPLISRITTMTGNACSAPKNYEVLIGTPVEHLLNVSNTNIKNTSRLVMGGPMMGFTIDQIQTPIIKASNCIIAATKQELPDPAMEQACIRCGMCTEACPAQLLPQQLYWFAKSSNLEQAESHNIADCIECGACSYVCPSNIPLVQYYRFAKGEIKQAQADKIKSDRAKVRFETRLARQEREAAEKEAKRQARAEAAAKKQAEKKAAASAEPQATSVSPTPVIDLDLLQKKFDASKTGVTKTKEKLVTLTADENADTGKIELLKAALEKAQSKMKDAAKTLAEAKKAEKASSIPASDKGDPNTPERLKNKLDLAQSRLETAKNRLTEAKKEDSDKVQLLEATVTKQAARVSEAQALHLQAIKDSEQNPAKDSPVKSSNTDIETLKQKVLAAQTRVDKANERLNMAIDQNLDTVSAFQVGLEKQTSKLADAKAALEKASTEEAK